MKIEHIALYVNDLQKTRSFFMKYLGAKSNEGYHNCKLTFAPIFCHLMMAHDWRL